MSGQTQGTGGHEPFDPYRKSAVSGSAAYAGAGLQFAVSLLVSLFLGQWLDRRLGTDPWLMMLGVFLGGGAGFYAMYRRLMAAQARDEAERRQRALERKAREQGSREQGSREYGSSDQRSRDTRSDPPRPDQ